MRVRLHHNLKIRKPGSTHHGILMAGDYSDSMPGGIPSHIVREIELGRPTVTILDGISRRNFLESRESPSGEEPDGTVHTMDTGEEDAVLAEQEKEEKPKKSSSSKTSSRRRRK